MNLDFFDGTPGTELWIARVVAPDAREGTTLALPRPGVSLAQLQRRLSSIRLRPDGATRKSWDFTPRVMPIAELVDDDLARTIVLLAACSGVLLLIASANVSSLLLARATARRREIAVRMAIGAGRWRVARALLLESGVLALGGAVGVAPALGMLELARVVRPADGPLLATVRLETSALACGLAPALLATRGDAHEALQGGRGQSAPRLTRRLRAPLVGGQFAASTLLLVTALLFARSLGAPQDVPPGYRPDGLASLSINFPPAQYTTSTARAAIMPEILARVRQLGGIDGATIALGTPMLSGMMRATVMREGTEATAVDEGFIPFRDILPDYFAITGIPVKRGRPPVAAGGERQAAIDEAMAANHWPGEDAVGQRFRLDKEGEPHVVTAVVGSVRRPEARSFGDGQLYLPTGDPELPENMQLLVRTVAGGELGALRRAGAAALAVDPFLRLQFARSERREMDRLLARPRFLASLLAGLAVAATVLAAVVLFGALAYSVAQRQREIGVRMALGAEAARVARSVAGDAVRIGGVRLGLGLAVAAGAGRGVARFLFGVQPLDPWSFGVTALALGAIARCHRDPCRLASRAARVEPMEAVRAE